MGPKLIFFTRGKKNSFLILRFQKFESLINIFYPCGNCIFRTHMQNVYFNPCRKCIVSPMWKKQNFKLIWILVITHTLISQIWQSNKNKDCKSLKNFNIRLIFFTKHKSTKPNKLPIEPKKREIRKLIVYTRLNRVQNKIIYSKTFNITLVLNSNFFIVLIVWA